MVRVPSSRSGGGIGRVVLREKVGDAFLRPAVDLGDSTMSERQVQVTKIVCALY